MSIDSYSISRLGVALGSPTRVTMCLAMLDGRAWTAGELALAAGVTRSTASEHLTTLLRSGLVRIQKQGRHAYVCLASPDAAHIVEAAAAFAGTPSPIASLRAATARNEMAIARTCYDHLAGGLGVALLDALVLGGHLSGELELTATGRNLFTEIAGPTTFTTTTRRPLINTCLDWTERRPHLSGYLGAVLLHAATEHDWVIPRSNSRALRITSKGLDAIHTIFGVAADAFPSHN